ncbi:MAG: DUF177 domain-containing protein [Clostridia bacterium]|nr:DUF177 domain-containing protein [Clostridia bacterium]
MLLNLRDVFVSQNSKIQVDYLLDLSDLSINGAYPLALPVQVHAMAENRAGLVRLYLDVSFVYHGCCDRCGDEFERSIKNHFEHILVLTLSGDSDDEYIETPDYELELDELVTADVILDMPSKFLCKDDCKGLCAVCGKNLNNDKCSCNKDRTDPRLEVLKQLLN